MCNFTSLAWSYYNIVFQWMNQLMTMASYSYVKKILFHIFGGYCGRFFKSMFFEKLNPTEHLLLICLTQSVGKTSNSSPWPLFHLGMSHHYSSVQGWPVVVSSHPFHCLRYLVMKPVPSCLFHKSNLSGSGIQSWILLFEVWTYMSLQNDWAPSI